MHVSRFPVLLVACLSLTPAYAQSSLVARQDSAERGFTTIKMNQSLTMPLNENDDPSAKQQEALKSFYSLVGGTCRTVIETIGETCEITSITFNFRSTPAQPHKVENQRNSIRIDGDVNMVVRLKPEVGPPTPENSGRRGNSPAIRY